MSKNKVPPALAYYGDELKRARAALGLTQEALAGQLHYSGSLVAQIENGTRYPTHSFSSALDALLETDGRFCRMAALARTAATPDWFRPWLTIEPEASSLRCFEPLLVAGLLQTEAYTRALLGDEAQVATRMERQAILYRDKPPELVVILDHAVLTTQVGSPQVMAEQLRLLADHPVARVQILPVGAGTYHGRDGAFTLADTADTEYVYLDAPIRGVVVDSVEVLLEARRRWDIIRGEALPQRQSRELILEEADKWDSRTDGASPPGPAPTAATV